MKTRLEWFNTMPEPYRSQAIENSGPEKLIQECNSPYKALDDGFTWSESPQGHDYWLDAARGNFLHAVKDELRVTKDRVLEAAERCSTTKEALKILFPEAFEDDKAVDLTSITHDNSKDCPGLMFPNGRPLVWYMDGHLDKLCLTQDYLWRIEIGFNGNIYLIPTKK